MSARRLRLWVGWFAALACATALLVAFRGRLDKAHVALLFLLVVLGASAAGGRALGVTLAFAAFLVFDVGFLPPYNTFVVTDRADWIVLAAFLITGIVAAELLERQRREAEVAREALALRRADRLKDALLASVSHDLRTPLTAIKGIANEIVRGEDASRAMLIEEEADRLTVLVNNLLDLSQLAAGEMRADLAVNTADDVVGSALQRIEPAFPDRAFEATLAEPWLELVGRFDFVFTMRILTNLLENAAKYAPEGTPVRIEVWREGAWLRFAVEDAGEGIPADGRERVFEPFVRGPGRTAGTLGTGLGLSIARRLAEVQHGRLECEPREGVMSRFVLSVPAASGGSALQESL